jgi:hypothetical protein
MFSSEDMSLTRLKKHFLYAGEAMKEALIAGLERGQQGQRASDLLRYQSVLRLLMSGRSMLSLLEMADLLRTSKHPHFKPNKWNRRQGWRDGEQLGRFVLKSTQQGLGAALAFALSCDESTDKGMLCQMVVHVYFLQNWVRKSKLLAIVDLELPASGLRLFEQLWDTLKTIGDLTDQQIIDGLVMFSADGASNLQGARNGVQKRLRDRVVKLLSMHCMAHRVQLVAKSTEQCMILTVLLALLRLAAKLYSKSPLRVLQLHHSQEKMQAPHYKLQKPATTRWIGYADPMARLNVQYTSVVDHTATRR